MGRKYDFEPQYFRNRLANEGQWSLLLLDFLSSFIWAQLVLNPEFPFKNIAFWFYIGVSIQTDMQFTCFQA